jgi:hypothetical protein
MKIVRWKAMLAESPRRLRLMLVLPLFALTASLVVLGVAVIDAQRPTVRDAERQSSANMLVSLASQLHQHRLSSGEYPEQLEDLFREQDSVAVPGRDQVGQDMRRVRYVLCPTRQEFLLWAPHNHWIGSFDVLMLSSLSHNEMVDALGNDQGWHVNEDGVFLIKGGTDVIDGVALKFRNGGSAEGR